MTSNDDGWIKARASSGGGDCVEMRQAGEVVQVRDSKLGPFSPIHTMARTSFSTWLEGAKNNEFDALT